jgi:hypothetical protein
MYSYVKKIGEALIMRENEEYGNIDVIVYF